MDQIFERLIFQTRYFAGEESCQDVKTSYENTNDDKNKNMPLFEVNIIIIICCNAFIVKLC